MLNRIVYTLLGIVVGLFICLYGLKFDLFEDFCRKEKPKIVSPKITLSKTGLVKERIGPRGLVNPLLECADREGLVFNELRTFKRKIVGYLEEQRLQGRMINTSVYFRDLNNGIWFGINENLKFIPASLFKLPLLLGYLKMAELNRNIFDIPITINEQNFPKKQYPQNIEPAATLQKGMTYTIRDLLTRMITYSDNISGQILFELNKGAYLQQVLDDLGLPTETDPKTGEIEIAIKHYAVFFRVLYNASYVDHVLSQQALELLSKVDFKGGLVAGLPEGITVAHKFGERVLDDVIQLHDCGIIYYPNKPYMLCVMTRGSNMENLNNIISEISRITYQEVSAQVH